MTHITIQEKLNGKVVDWIPSQISNITRGDALGRQITDAMNSYLLPRMVIG